MSRLVFFAVVASASALVASLVFSIAQPGLRVWSLPSRNERACRVRRIANRVAGIVVALAGAGVLGLALLDRGSLPLPTGLRWFVGALLFGFGAVFGLWGYVQLGPDASQGSLAPLVTSGPYRYSRNPQYVGAIAVLLGFGLLCSSKLGLLAGAVCCIWFLTAPFAEEPWLSEHLGARYDDYSLSTPRFLGIPKRKPMGGAPSRHGSC